MEAQASTRSYGNKIQKFDGLGQDDTNSINLGYGEKAALQVVDLCHPNDRLEELVFDKNWNDLDVLKELKIRYERNYRRWYFHLKTLHKVTIHKVNTRN
jgi:hypothetical protein